MTFFTELQKIEFFSEYLQVVIKMKSDFAQKVKKRGSWQIVQQGKDKIDDLAKPVYNNNVIYHSSKASQEVALKTIGLKADYIHQYNPNKKYTKRLNKSACISLRKKPVN